MHGCFLIIGGAHARVAPPKSTPMQALQWLSHSCRTWPTPWNVNHA